jgi:crotonobetainyl-CoA:carnitine CoA-transferase CaiB-like acyl-CoA transferase
MGGLLDGIRIVDVTAVFSGPYASLLLGDLGADVIKVESPIGDIARRIGVGQRPGMGPLFVSTNRNKRSLCVDLRQPRGGEVVERLIDWADVLLHNMRPAAARRLGIDPESVLARNPRAVHCALTGFGSSGPYADLPAYDDVVQAASGLVSVQTPPGERPVYVRSVVADKVAGLAAFGVVAAALVQRDRTGVGVAVEVPMLETMTSFVLLEHQYGVTFDPPSGEARYPRMVSDERRPFRTADGWISVVFYDDRHWDRFFDLIGQPELATDPRFADHGARIANTDGLYAMVAEVMATRTTEQWLHVLRELDVPAMAVREVEELFDDPHLQAVAMFETIDEPEVGRYTRVRNPFSVSTGVDVGRLPPPPLGRDTAAVLLDLGYGEDEVAALIAAEVAFDAEAAARR